MSAGRPKGISTTDFAILGSIWIDIAKIATGNTQGCTKLRHPNHTRFDQDNNSRGLNKITLSYERAVSVYRNEKPRSYPRLS
jgi:hypothetical protein